jgi:thioredoxin reductase
VSTADGRRWVARAVILATGLRDELPDVPGVADLWGRDVVACPHCHGWEVRGLPLAQLGIPGMAARGVQRAELLSRWSPDVLLFTDGDELSPQQRDRLARAGVDIRTEPVRRLIHSDGRLESVETISGHPRAAAVAQVKGESPD